MSPSAVGTRVFVCAAILGGATIFAVLPICDLLFECGCTWPWAGGISHCNIYDADGPHCPWCIYPVSTDLSLGAMLLAQALGAWAVARRRGGVVAPLVGGGLAGGAAALVARSVIVWWTGYEMVHTSPL